MEHVARETLGVDPHQRRRSVGQIAHLEHYRFFPESIMASFEAVDPKDTELRGKIRFSHFSQP
jgi:hypothetical protein